MPVLGLTHMHDPPGTHPATKSCTSNQRSSDCWRFSLAAVQAAKQRAVVINENFILSYLKRMEGTDLAAERYPKRQSCFCFPFIKQVKYTNVLRGRYFIDVKDS